MSYLRVSNEKLLVPPSPAAGDTVQDSTTTPLIKYRRKRRGDKLKSFSADSANCSKVGARGHVAMETPHPGSEGRLSLDTVYYGCAECEGETEELVTV